MSNNEDDIDISQEFTLEETYKHLKKLKIEGEQEIKQLMNVIQNNEVKTLGPNITPEEIKVKRLKFIESMHKFISEEQPKDLLVPSTPDYYTNVLQSLEDEVHTMEELDKMTDEEISELEKDIA